MEQLWQTYSSEIVGTIGMVCACVLIYLFIQRSILPGTGTRKEAIGRRWLISIGILVLFLAVMIDVWEDKFNIIRSIDAYLNKQEIYPLLLWIVGGGLGIYLLSILVMRKLMKGAIDLEARHRIRSTVRWAGLGAFLLLMIFAWLQHLGLKDAATFLGLVGAGIALSLQETTLCVIGWLLIMINRLYDIGDRIEIDGMRGDVINITIFQTQVLEVGNWVYGDQSTGRILTIPNARAFRGQVFNYTRGFPFIWNELQTTVTFESNWKRARDILLDTAYRESEKTAGEVRRQIETMQRDFAIHYQHLTPIVYTSVNDNGIGLTLRYLTPVRKRRQTEHEVSERALDALLAAPDIDFAYPTTRIFRNIEEGKPGAGGPPKDHGHPDLPPHRVMG